MPKRIINKSEFVRSLGDLSAKDVVAKAAARGIKLSMAHVYTIRSAANRKAGSAATATRRPGRPAKASSNNVLRATIDRLATKFAEEILSAVRGASLNDLLHR
jgi:hypothetical protein